MSGSDLGALLDPTGEHLYLVDDAGNVCEPVTALELFVAMTADRNDSGVVAIPISASREVARIATERGLEVRWTKTAADALMNAAASADVVFAGDPEGAYIFPGTLAAADAMMALAKVLEHRARTRRSLSELLSPLPRVAVAHEPVPCPWEMKGTVMREIMEHADGDRVDLLDGVKVFHRDDWVLVLPDPDQPIVHVWAESSSDAKARALAGTQVRLIRNLVG